MILSQPDWDLSSTDVLHVFTLDFPNTKTTRFVNYVMNYELAVGTSCQSLIFVGEPYGYIFVFKIWSIIDVNDFDKMEHCHRVNKLVYIIDDRDPLQQNFTLIIRLKLNWYMKQKFIFWYFDTWLTGSVFS